MNLKSKLIKKLKKEFPEIRFKQVKLVTQGWDHDVLILDNRIVFRFAKEKDYKINFAREVEFLKFFGKISNLRVPQYIYLSKDKTFGGYEIIHGKELGPKMFNRLSAEKKLKLIKDLAKFLTILHTIPLSKLKQFHYKDYNSRFERKGWFKNEYIAKMAKYLSAVEMNFVTEFIGKIIKDPPKFKKVLGHFDLSHSHILMKPNGSISGIIDFGDMNFGDPAKEFNGFWEYDPKLIKELYKFYNGPKDRNFLNRSYNHFVQMWIFLMYDGKIRRKSAKLWLIARKEINKIIKQQNG